MEGSEGAQDLVREKRKWAWEDNSGSDEEFMPKKSKRKKAWEDQATAAPAPSDESGDPEDLEAGGRCAHLPTTWTTAPDGCRIIEIVNEESLFFGEQMKEIRPNDCRWKLILTEKLLKGKETRLMALKCRRDMSGEPCDAKVRTKEEAVVAGTLICANALCGAKAGDQYGRELGMCLNVFSFEADGKSPEHQKSRGEASTHVNVVAREIETGVAQWLCKICHPLKSYGYSYLYEEEAI
ncbi:hypothetical protein TrCOL_g7858 [Triparma columacea]|uniref:Uncharacterized protein n=1 Tax=Triparma columacea TaxID=722753 RepID=A0A9W7L7E7_9STRA|nr:hypothetical protein TrCOL_g7858 [Triparma columacea]